MRRLIFLWILTLLVTPLRAQEQLRKKEVLELRRSAIRSLPPDMKKSAASTLLDSMGWPGKRKYSDGRIVEIRRLNPNRKPEYVTTFNSIAAKTVSTDKVRKEAGQGFDLEGDGMVVGVWDAGVMRTTHVEFGDRARVMDDTEEVSGHATHVSGTIGAAGLDAAARGMAGKAVIEGYDWDLDLPEMETAASEGLLLSNHSYGFVLGWDYNLDEERWEWYGDLLVSETEDYLFGFYHPETYENDRIAYENPYYLIVKSAGNDRGEGPPPGTEHYVWEDGDWVVSTRVRPKDGGNDGFNTIDPVASAKNILAIGAINDMPSGYTDPGNVVITGYSAFGPADDGRIKPDLVGNGVRLYSTYSDSDTDYRSISGTSMSAPNITGSLALIQEQHYKLFEKYMTAAALKGLAIHTAGDAGEPGPDYKFGWGVLNTLEAVKLISDGKLDRLRELSLAQGEEYRLKLYANGNEPVKVTICWTDPPGHVPAPSLNPDIKQLVNDLDVRLVRVKDGQQTEPFVLDKTHPSMQASRGDNLVDNVEQVLLESPPAGFYEIIVSHKGRLTGKSQEVALLFSGLTDEYVASGVTELNGNNGAFVLTSAPGYLPDMDAAWQIKPGNGFPIKLYFNFFSTEPGHDFLRIYDGADETAPLIASLDGDQQTDLLEINSSSGQLYVRFVSDSQVQGEGFSAVYCTIPPEDSTIIQGDPFPCEGSIVRYLTAGAAGVNYTWTAPDGWETDSLLNDGIDLFAGSMPGVLKVTPFNRCGSGPESGLQLTSLNSIPAISGYLADTLPCAGVVATVEVAEVTGATYNWQLPENWPGSSEEHILDYIPGSEPGVITVNVRNSCGYGDTVSVLISGRTAPDSEKILTSRYQPCALTEQEFYVNTREEHSYHWEVADDWSIIGNPDNDTVLVSVGSRASDITVYTTNKCGVRKSESHIVVSPLPDQPLIQVNNSIYEGYRLLSISNASSFTGFQWYRDDSAIPAPQGQQATYVAFLPGYYTAGVTNREGCVRKNGDISGIEIQEKNQVYSVVPGLHGHINILNHTAEQASVRIYDFTGRLLLITTADPGHNEIPFLHKGVFIVSVTGSLSNNTSRVFMH